jgi:hypothetical protein
LILGRLFPPGDFQRGINFQRGIKGARHGMLRLLASRLLKKGLLPMGKRHANEER